MMHFAGKSAAAVAFAAALAAAPAAFAANPNSAVWTPQAYSLGGPTLIPAVISTRLDTADNEEDVTVTGSRAPTSTIGASDYSTPQSVFNIGGNPMIRPADCMQEYTTTAGQPANANDLSGSTGIRGCYL